MARKIKKVLILTLLFVTLFCTLSYAFTLPDIKNTLTYKARARELGLGISFELWQQDRYSLELQFTGNFAGLSILYHWIPLVEISSGFMLGFDPHEVRLEYGLVLFAWISW